MDVRQLEREIGRKVVAGKEMAGFAQIVEYTDILGKTYYSNIYAFVKTFRKSIGKSRVVLKTLGKDGKLLFEPYLN